MPMSYFSGDQLAFSVMQCKKSPNWYFFTKSHQIHPQPLTPNLILGFGRLISSWYNQTRHSFKVHLLVFQNRLYVLSLEITLKLKTVLHRILAIQFHCPLFQAQSRKKLWQPSLTHRRKKSCTERAPISDGSSPKNTSPSFESRARAGPELRPF